LKFDFPQLLIFPEGNLILKKGTCTNGKALISFKNGPFQPGKNKNK
jgi:hypothetical protein